MDIIIQIEDIIKSMEYSGENWAWFCGMHGDSVIQLAVPQELKLQANYKVLPSRKSSWAMGN